MKEFKVFIKVKVFAKIQEVSRMIKKVKEVPRSFKKVKFLNFKKLRVRHFKVHCWGGWIPRQDN